MKIVINKNVYGWVMTGIIGKDGKWFIGYSTAPKGDNND